MVKKFVGSMCAISLELLLVTTDIFYLFFFFEVSPVILSKKKLAWEDYLDLNAIENFIQK